MLVSTRICLVTVFLLCAAAARPQTADPLVDVLVSKGVLTAAEAESVRGPALSGGQRLQLLAVLRDKGILSTAEYASLAGGPEKATAAPGADESKGTKPGIAAATTPPGPTVAAAIAPLQPIPVNLPKREGLIPAIKLGAVTMKPYGFIKASLINDTSSPYGNDFPLPGFLGDSGPNASPEFHVKARFVRVGSNFEWLDPSAKWIFTGRVEADFEGNFSRVYNRNVSSIRSNAMQLRLAWGRMDRVITDKTSVHLLIGQDWTPFGSSTLPYLEETTGLGVGFGTLYERLPQFRFGAVHTIGGLQNLKISPEFAVVMPAFGDLPSNIGDQLGYGERQGADSDRPEVQARVVAQFQLDQAPGVAPAQIIGSAFLAKRTAIVTAADVPAAFKAMFPHGTRTSSDARGYTVELQLPTRVATVLAKYYSGQDLRFYFSGQLFSNFNDPFGLTATATAPSIDGASNVIFGLRGGVPAVAPQRPVRSLGGFVNVGLPVSRWFGANPKGRMAGWGLYFNYGYDYAFARDVRRIAGGRSKGDVIAGDLEYKLNHYVSFVFEQSLYRTRAANHAVNATGGLPLFRGIPTFQWHDLRSELATVFSF